MKGKPYGVASGTSVDSTGPHGITSHEAAWSAVSLTRLIKRDGVDSPCRSESGV
jgi:hypothetical protein